MLVICPFKTHFWAKKANFSAGMRRQHKPYHLFIVFIFNELYKSNKNQLKFFAPS